MPLAIALERGYYGDKIREPGDTFEVTKFDGEWFEPVDKKAKKAAAPAAAPEAPEPEAQ